MVVPVPVGQWLLCEAPAEVLQQRLLADTEASDATHDMLAQQQPVFEWPATEELARAWRLDTARPRAVDGQCPGLAAGPPGQGGRTGGVSLGHPGHCVVP